MIRSVSSAKLATNGLQERAQPEDLMEEIIHHPTHGPQASFFIVVYRSGHLSLCINNPAK